MNNNQKPHFWIPDQEVIQLDKELRARAKKRTIDYAEHGAKLSQDLKELQQTIATLKNDDSLRDFGLYIAKIAIQEGEKIHHQAKVLSNNGMELKAVKDDRHAIVSMTQGRFHSLENKVAKYQRNGKGKTKFEVIESITPYIGSEKNSSTLKKRVGSKHPPATIDIQLMLVPNLEEEQYERAIDNIKEKITDTEGTIQHEPYLLSDNTPVIRVVIPSSALCRYENDPAIYRIEETRFFRAGNDFDSEIIPSLGQIDTAIDIDELPIVAVLDSGVHFPPPLDQLILTHWYPQESSGGNAGHGTSVASKVAFRNIASLAVSPVVTPRARIIDCNILDDDKVAEDLIINRIQQAVAEHADVAKIYNLSIGSESPIEGDEMSLLGFELDALQRKHNIQFVVSAGNHVLWQHEATLESILDDDDSRIASPADSMLSIVVGSVVSEKHAGSLSGKNEVAPYSRRGPGFAGYCKPDLCAYGATFIQRCSGDIHIPADPSAMVLTHKGTIRAEAGTSYCAPAVAGDLAEISKSVSSDILLAKALLYHHAQPLGNNIETTEEETLKLRNIYGRGISCVTDSKYSSPSCVTFVRTGTLNKVTKERVKIYMPQILAAYPGRNTAKVMITCLSLPNIDRTKGNQYIGAYIRATLKKRQLNDKLAYVSDCSKNGRQAWDPCQQFDKTFSNFKPGDWEIWLETCSRWDEDKTDISYALVVTIEDLSGTLDIYNEIQAQNRYQALVDTRVRTNIQHIP